MPKLPLHRSLARANRILKEVRKIDFPKSFVEEVIIECVSNCREQGYIIRQFQSDWAISFAECRNSDSIVVYVGKHGHMAGNIPEDAAYDSKRFFFKIEDAIKFVITSLKEQSKQFEEEELAKVEVTTRVLSGPLA